MVIEDLLGKKDSEERRLSIGRLILLVIGIILMIFIGRSHGKTMTKEFLTVIAATALYIAIHDSMRFLSKPIIEC